MVVVTVVIVYVKVVCENEKVAISCTGIKYSSYKRMLLKCTGKHCYLEMICKALGNGYCSATEVVASCMSEAWASARKKGTTVQIMSSPYVPREITWI